ncbi:MAG: phosphate acetyltransferase [Caldilineae bacterium]|nr:MAG: phosphate acetyltransferase [Caldilineae bacterium]
MRLGDRATCRRVFSAEDLVAYKMLVGRGELAAGVGIAPGDGEEGRRVPPALVGGLFSYLLGTRLPGPGTNYLKQYLRFRAAAYPEQELRAAVEIVRIRVDKQLVNLRTVCTNARDEVVAEGEALVLVSDVS